MIRVITKIVIIAFAISATSCSSINKKKGESEPQSQSVPKLKRPEVRKVWVPDQIVGDEFVSGHWKYVIQKNVVWTKSEE